VRLYGSGALFSSPAFCVFTNDYSHNNNLKTNKLMAKKSAISGEYLIQVEDSGSVIVCRIFDNVKASLREIAALKEFEYNPDWTTRQFGSHICKEFGDGKTATVGGYVIQVRENGSIESYRNFENTKAALREIAEKIGFEYSTDWTTRQFGSKLVDAIEGK
jgi:hypothetical protein